MAGWVAEAASLYAAAFARRRPMLPLLHRRAMTDAPKYTTQLQAGLGLVPETLKLLAIWEPGMTGPDLLKAALASGEFPNVTARRLRNVIIEAFCPRYLVDDAAPARLLKALSASRFARTISVRFASCSPAAQI